MGSIGLAELVVVALIFLMLAAPIVVVVWLIKRSASTSAVQPGLVRLSPTAQTARRAPSSRRSEDKGPGPSRAP